MKPIVLGGGGDRFHQADYLIGRYAAKPPTGTTLEDVLQPEYFRNNLDSLKPGMEITVVSDDFKLDCVLRVLTVAKVTANMRVLRVYSDESAPEVEVKDDSISDVAVKWGGPNHLWRIQHGDAVVDKGYSTQDEAAAARVKYLESIKNA